MPNQVCRRCGRAARRLDGDKCLTCCSEMETGGFRCRSCGEKVSHKQYYCDCCRHIRRMGSGRLRKPGVSRFRVKKPRFIDVAPFILDNAAPDVGGHYKLPEAGEIWPSA